MKLVRYRTGSSQRIAIGIVVDNEVIDVGSIAPADQFDTNQWMGLDTVYVPIFGAIASDISDDSAQRAAKSGVVRHQLANVELMAPVVAGSFRDFYAFEQHVKNARKNRGLEMAPEWYSAPVFYFSNVAGLTGPNAPIRKPPETQELDFELEIAVVIGKEGSDISIDVADDYIAGFTILNDWSARDLQRQEMKVGLGPAKGKDFATSIGPFLVTPDELEAHLLSDQSRGKRYDLTMTATVNGHEISRGNASDMRWTFAELIAHASRNTTLLPGDLIGSGTVGTGCITEFPKGTYPWLQPGDLVRLEIGGLGALENRIVE